MTDGIFARVRRANRRSRDAFRRESKELDWTAWLVGWLVAGVVLLGALALMATLGHPVWSLASGFIGAFGGLALARLYFRRHRG